MVPVFFIKKLLVA